MAKRGLNTFYFERFIICKFALMQIHFRNILVVLHGNKKIQNLEHKNKYHLNFKAGQQT